LLITHSHGRQAAQRLGIPLFRMGVPMFDWLGAGHLVSVGYRGTRDLIFAIGNMLMHQHFHHAPTPETWREHPSAPPAAISPAPTPSGHSEEELVP
jgi:nitrogenase molybdenum-iron protein NifN